MQSVPTRSALVSVPRVNENERVPDSEDEASRDGDVVAVLVSGSLAVHDALLSSGDPDGTQTTNLLPLGMT